LYDLGSISTASPTINFGTPSDFLVANTSYAVVLQISGSDPAWQSTTTTGSGGDGSLGLAFQNEGSGWTSSNPEVYQQMDLEVVPEVPMTGMVMGFGGFVIAIGHTARRKLAPIFSALL
jgi:hypothetical protein